MAYSIQIKYPFLLCNESFQFLLCIRHLKLFFVNKIMEYSQNKRRFNSFLLFFVRFYCCSLEEVPKIQRIWQWKKYSLHYARFHTFADFSSKQIKIQMKLNFVFFFFLFFSFIIIISCLLLLFCRNSFIFAFFFFFFFLFSLLDGKILHSTCACATIPNDVDLFL